MIGSRVEPPRVGSPRRVLLQQTVAPTEIRAWAIRRGFGQDFDAVPCRMHRQQAKAQQPAQTVRPMIPIPATARRQNRQPDLIRNAQTLDPLQHQLHGEGHFQLGDHKRRRFASAHGHDIAAAHLSLHLKAPCLKEGFDDVIERGL
jgi:hypothetical protein